MRCSVESAGRYCDFTQVDSQRGTASDKGRCGVWSVFPLNVCLGTRCVSALRCPLAKAGASVVEMQSAGRWKSPQMPAHYARVQEAEQGAVARLRYGRGGRQ